MSRDRPGPDSDRLIVARLAGVAQRHARWGTADEAQMTAGAAELRDIADGRADLLAEVGGVAIGTSEGKGEEYEAQARAVAELCRLAGAAETLIRQWIEEGRRRPEARRMPPFSQGGARAPWRSRRSG
jgi:hypothetical protein